MKLRLSLIALVALLGACGGADAPDKKIPDTEVPDDETTQLVTVPGAPIAVKAEVSFNNVTVSWQAPASDGGSAITGYKLVSTPESKVVEVGADVLEAYFAELSPDTSYTFSVSALNAKGESEKAVTNEVTTLVPPSPAQNVVAIAANASLSVTWEAPASGTVTGYTVKTQPESSTQTLGAEARSATISGLTNGTAYRVSVVAVTEAGESNPALSNEVVPFGVPGKVQNIVAVATGTTVSLSWDAANENGREITEYTVKPSTGAEISVSGTSAEFTGLTPQLAYTFTVRAKSEAGLGEAGVSNSVTTSGPPGAPTMTYPITGNLSVKVSWVTPNSNGGSPITGYILTASPAIGAPVELDGSTQTYEYTNLVAGTQYSFQVQAVNAAGAGPLSDPSVTVTIDADECVNDTHTCTGAQGCRNTIGSFTCENLVSFFSSSPVSINFQATTTSYTVPLSAIFPSVSLRVNIVSGASMTLDGVALNSGTVSPPIEVGPEGRTVSLVVKKNSSSVTYTFNFTRTLGVGYLKATHAAAGDTFGTSVAAFTFGQRRSVLSGVPFERGAATSTAGTFVGGVTNAGAAYVQVLMDGVWTREAYLKAPNAEADDLFGAAVSIGSNYLAIGAPGEDGDQNSTKESYNNNATDAGAVYIYKRDSAGNWSLHSYLKAPNAGAGDRFGSSVSYDDSFLIVGAPGEDGNSTSRHNASNDSATDAGAAYVYHIDSYGTGWVLEGYLKATNAEANDKFGSSVSVSGFNTLIGAPGERGDSNSRLNSFNNNAADAGAAYIFNRASNAPTWSQKAYLKAPDAAANHNAGASVSLSGYFAVVSSVGNNAANVFSIDGPVTTTPWSHIQKLSPPADASSSTGFGHRVSTFMSTVAVSNQSIDGQGAVYLYSRGDFGLVWSYISTLTAPNKHPNMKFGGDVSVNRSVLAVGAPAEDGDKTSTLASPNRRESQAGASYGYPF